MIKNFAFKFIRALLNWKRAKDLQNNSLWHIYSIKERERVGGNRDKERERGRGARERGRKRETERNR